MRNDLSFDKLPRLAEFQKYQRTNQFVGRAKDGRVISYINWGSRFHPRGLKKAFSVDEYVDGTSNYAPTHPLLSRLDFWLTVYKYSSSPTFAVVLYSQELSRLLQDAIDAVEARHGSFIAFYDFSGGSLEKCLGLMACELSSLFFRSVYLISRQDTHQVELQL